MVYAQNIIVNYVIELFEATDLLQLNIIIYMTVWFRFMVFNATFNNISVISWRSILLVEETGIPLKYHHK
jgi:hypothetical protein